MPVYLGATDVNLASGAAHLSQTSLPIGGENTNCVIAGHRGWNGAAYFRYVPDLEKGDFVTLQNLWETLTYVRILDKKGFIKVQRNDGKTVQCKAGAYRNVVSQLWEELAIYQQDAILRPDYYICAGARVMDFSGSVDLDKIMMLMEVEMLMLNTADDVIIVGAKNSL